MVDRVNTYRSRLSRRKRLVSVMTQRVNKTDLGCCNSVRASEARANLSVTRGDSRIILVEP
jgi:hypothetical protein